MSLRHRIRPLASLAGAARLICLVGVGSRLARGRRRRAPLAAGAPCPPGPVSVVIPARNEAERLGPCLEGVREDPCVSEVVVVDDRSSDGTAAIAAAQGARVVLGTEPPPGWVGKPWALDQGLRAARGDWVLFLDADTRPRPGLTAALVSQLAGAAPVGELDVVTAGPRFDCASFGERLLHPAMLASLVLRFGPADALARQPPPARVTGNGQCLAVRRERLLAVGGFRAAAHHMTDDIALLRALAAEGWRVGFVDARALLDVRMHTSVGEVWREWGRSLAMTDASPRGWLALDLAVIALAMGIPLPRVLAGRATPLDLAFLTVRLALLPALAGSYIRRGPAFWLSPLADPAVALRLVLAVARPSRRWRGRTYR